MVLEFCAYYVKDKIQVQIYFLLEIFGFEFLCCLFGITLAVLVIYLLWRVQTEPPICSGLWETQDPPQKKTWGLLVYRNNFIIIEMIVLKTF